MVRRARVGRSNQLAADDEALPADQPQPARSAVITVPWRGAGGRWVVWVARAVAWAVLLLIGYRGVLAIVEGQSTGTTSTGTTASAAATAARSQFPVTAAEAYALEFGHVYLNFSPATATSRGRTLATFLPRGTDPQLGWDGAGTQRVRDEQVSNVAVTSAHTAVVTLLARLSGDRLVELGVPIYAAGGTMSVSGDPALLPGPAKASPPTGKRAAADHSTEGELRTQLPAFFTAYADGDQATLARFAAPGAHLSGLGGSVTFGALDSVYAPAGGSSRRIVATVTWQLPADGSTTDAASVGTSAASLKMTYQLVVVRQRSSWNVKSIGAAGQGQP